MKQVAIRHPKFGLEGKCLPEALPAWLSQGWVVADATPEPVQEPEPEPESDVTDVSLSDENESEDEE